MYTTFSEMAESQLVKGSALRVLEFDKIRERLIGTAKTVYGKEVSAELFPTSDLVTVEKWQQQTEDSLLVFSKKGYPPLSGLFDIRKSLSLVRAGGTLSLRNLLEIGSFLKTISQVKIFSFSEDTEFAENVFCGMVQSLVVLEHIEKEIQRCILSEDEINERASEKLYSISRKIREKQSSVRVILDRIVRNRPEALQEQLVTIRNDRYVVPVKSEKRSEVPGIIHDMSSSGQTVFIEPTSVVELNNEIRELLLQKKEEIERILAALSQLVQGSQRDFNDNIQIAGLLDFWMAKAALSYDMEATRPLMNDKGIVELRRARHPLIPKQQVVPIDFSIGEEYRTLVITGPNTGGKTVSLKTCGLFCLMAMAGLHIPCLDHSRVSVFKKVLADIGDEQSIEQSLSTFSSHMKNLVSILKEVQENTMVLADELGSGTDPSEGAALAISILEELREKGAVTVATTHYKELKSYAVETENVENACCEFDTETLSPTYRLLIGMPGVSNAFQISGKLGLSSHIISRARNLLTKEGLQVEELLASAEKVHRESEKRKKEIRQIRSYVKHQESEIEKEKATIEEKKEKILQGAQKEKKSLLEDAYEEIQDMIDAAKAELDKENKEAALSKLHQIRSNLRAGISDLEAPVTKEVQKAAWGKKPKEIVIGQRYEAPSLGVSGIAVKGPDSKGNYIIESGSVRLTVSSEDLFEPRKVEPVLSPLEKRKKRQVSTQVKNAQQIKTQKAATVMPEIQLLGMTVDQAILALDQYLDDCVLANIGTIRIVHGKGTGALRSAVSSHLRSDRRVQNFRLGTFGEGEDGVTIAEL